MAPARQPWRVSSGRRQPAALPPGENQPFVTSAQVAAFRRKTLFNQTCTPLPWRGHAVSKNLPGPDLTRLDRAAAGIFADAEVRARCIADNDAFFLVPARGSGRFYRVRWYLCRAWKGVPVAAADLNAAHLSLSKGPHMRPD